MWCCAALDYYAINYVLVLSYLMKQEVICDLGVYYLKLKVAKEKIKITRARDQGVMLLYGWELLAEYQSF